MRPLQLIVAMAQKPRIEKPKVSDAGPAAGSGIWRSGLLLLFLPLSVAAERPNFIFMLSDDQSWNGLAFSMHPDMPHAKLNIDTPHLASLAKRGMRFSDAYAPAPVCSPTRISLQTGKSPAQLHWTKAAPTATASDGFKLISPVLKRAISASETTIAELLGQAGYATAHYGKWHIQGGGPEAHGYDESDGDTGNADAEPFVDPNPVDIFGMGERAMAFMNRSKQENKPFFIQLSYHALHYPGNARKATLAKYQARLVGKREKEVGRAALAEDLDSGIGLLLGKVDELGLRDNTYLIYMSDNGAGSRGIMSGGKGSIHEGGIRVPLIIAGPGIAPGSWCRQRVVGFDLLPTFCELAGIRSLPRGIEGGSFVHLLRAVDMPVSRPGELVFHFPHYQSADGPSSAIYDGDHKLLYFYETQRHTLYNLVDDLAERRDLAAEQPERSQQLLARLHNYLKNIGAQFPTSNPQYDPANSPPPRRGKGEVKKKGKKPRSSNFQD
jgi:arylsulfatase A